ncbi:hypothetical protein C8R45DRAFT_1175350, partial [Mycena sanguinolenta]
FLDIPEHSNHGSFCFNQLSALKLLVNDVQGSINASNTYSRGFIRARSTLPGTKCILKHPFSEKPRSSLQPFEAVRTRPYHYRNYNPAAMITNARILESADPTSDPWNITAKYGATIQDALDMVMALDPNTSGEGDAIAEIYPNIAAVASKDGDPDRKYVAFLQKVFPKYAWTRTSCETNRWPEATPVWRAIALLVTRSVRRAIALRVLLVPRPHQERWRPKH